MCSLLLAAGSVLSIFALVEDHTFENIWTALIGLDLCFAFVGTQRWVSEDRLWALEELGGDHDQNSQRTNGVYLQKKWNN